MADRISSLPDELLCYILSFLQTKLSVSTSVLSKRWKDLWRSVPALDLHYSLGCWKESSHPDSFLSLWNFILSNLEQPIQRFYLTIYPFHHMSVDHINSFVRATMSQGRLRHLDLRVGCSVVDMSPNLSSCRTLTVLKLQRVKLKIPSSAYFPVLKVLHLHGIIILGILGGNHLQQILSASPNLEELEVKNVYGDYETMREFKPLPNLLRAAMDRDLVPLKMVDNVQFLSIRITVPQEKINDSIPVFHNLTHLEFIKSYYPKPSVFWHDAFKVIKGCPKLQNLSIDTGSFIGRPSMDDFLFSQCVPRCIYFNLKTCSLNNYTGTSWEIEFAKYIMENAKFLKDMIVCCATRLEGNMMKELSSCSRLSSVCKLYICS